MILDEVNILIGGILVRQIVLYNAWSHTVTCGALAPQKDGYPPSKRGLCQVSGL